MRKYAYVQKIATIGTLAWAVSIGCAEPRSDMLRVSLELTLECSQGEGAAVCRDLEVDPEPPMSGDWYLEDIDKDFTLINVSGREFIALRFASGGELLTPECGAEHDSATCLFGRERVDTFDTETGCTLTEEVVLDLRIVDDRLIGQRVETSTTSLSETECPEPFVRQRVETVDGRFIDFATTSSLPRFTDSLALGEEPST